MEKTIEKTRDKRRKKKAKRIENDTYDDDESVKMAADLAMLNQKGGVEGMNQSFHLPNISVQNQQRTAFDSEVSRNGGGDQVERTSHVTP